METFVPQSMQENYISLIIGRRACGKYSLLKDLLYHLRFRFQRSYHASSPTQCNPENSFTCQEPCIFEAKHFSLQASPKPTCAVIQDLQCSKELEYLMHHHRHLRTTLFLCLQTLRRFYCEYEEEVRYVFCFRTNHSELSFLYKKFFTDVFTSFELYQEAIVLLKPYECLVLDTLTLRCYTYKASIDIPQYILHEDCPDRTLCDDSFKLRLTLVSILSAKCPQSVANFIVDFLHPAKHSCCLK